jgi:serine/threonine protein kinase
MSKTGSPTTIIRQYRVLTKIGEGGMGEVYLAQDTKLGRKVALKVLPADVIDNPERLRRFEREAQAASALNHPNIITIHEIGRSGETHFIVTEFIEGETLRRKLKRTRLEIAETLEIATQYATAVQKTPMQSLAVLPFTNASDDPQVEYLSDGLTESILFGLSQLPTFRSSRELRCSGTKVATRIL